MTAFSAKSDVEGGEHARYTMAIVKAGNYSFNDIQSAGFKKLFCVRSSR